MGRYKYNKKLSLATRIAGHKLTQPAIDPLTGELLAEPGEILTRERAHELDKKGVAVAFIEVGEQELKCISNNMVNIHDFVDYDLTGLGINEKVRFVVLKELLEANLSEEEFKEQVRLRRDELIPKHIILDDIFALSLIHI